MERGLGESKVISDLVNLKDKADSFFIKSANLNNNSCVQFKRHHNVDLFLNIIDYYDIYTLNIHTVNEIKNLPPSTFHQ